MTRPVKVSTVLRRLGACAPALAWVRRWEREHPRGTLAMMWVACPNAFWLSWLTSTLDFRRDLQAGTWDAIWRAWTMTLDDDAPSLRRAVGWLHWPAIESAFLRAAAEVRHG